ncbi:MAG: tRNA (guanosine(46)-N7)-methyltransferase TrmB [Patescibacteria group bacterium]|nr:tRNA (guanosine(46)-N7)-methyltransferase TrmB [Patescibacteria group bacterium]
MGRRALRQIAPDLDLSGWLLCLDELPKTVTSDTLFGQRRPLQIEVGSGRGLFLRTAAATEPQHGFLGCEVVHKYAQLTALGLASRNLDNAKVLGGDALRLFAEFLPDQSVAAVHVYFPDPWWKRRHRKRRVMRESFLRDVERVLEPGGCLHFWTDVEEYFRVSLKAIAAHSRLEGPIPVEQQPAEHDLDYRTHFERRMRQHQADVFRSLFRKH